MKELKKMNLNELKSLSRREMKNVMAGSGITGGSGGNACTDDAQCKDKSGIICTLPTGTGGSGKCLSTKCYDGTTYLSCR
jgi:hypothetical protein